MDEVDKRVTASSLVRNVVSAPGLIVTFVVQALSHASLQGFPLECILRGNQELDAVYFVCWPAEDVKAGETVQPRSSPLPSRFNCGRCCPIFSSKVLVVVIVSTSAPLSLSIKQMGRLSHAIHAATDTYRPYRRCRRFQHHAIAFAITTDKSGTLGQSVLLGQHDRVPDPLLFTCTSYSRIATVQHYASR